MALKCQFNDYRISFLGEEARYAGDMKEFPRLGLVPDGDGFITLKNGDRFDGKFKKGQPTVGKYTYQNGSFVTIKFSFNLAGTKCVKEFEHCGFCGYKITKCDYPNGRYEGELNGLKRHGIGKYYFNNGDVYEGGWKNGKKHGSGKYTFDNGDYEWSVWNEGEEVVVSSRYIEGLGQQFVSGKIEVDLMSFKKEEELDEE